MSKPEFDQNDQDNASMFDFLSDDTDGLSTRRPAPKNSKRKAMPIIRKPVPISKSGPLLPPKPGDPVEPPPPLTTGMAKEAGVGAGKKTRISDELDFLDETRAEVPDLRPANRNKSRSTKLDNVRPLHKAGTNDEKQMLEQEFQHLGSPRKTNDVFEFETDWRAGHASYEDFPEENSAGWLRWALLVGAFVLFAGGGFYAYTAGYLNELIASTGTEFEQPGDRIAFQPTDAPTVSPELPSPGIVETLPAAAEPVATTVPVESTLFVRFRSQLAAIESMVENGSLGDAEQVLANMDRSVYGYGAAEFSALENQIVSIRSKQSDERNAVELADAERIEHLRLTNEAALLAEQIRQDIRDAEAAAAETVRLEQVRIEADKAQLARETASAAQAEFAQEQLAAELAARNADKIRLDALEEVAREEARRQLASADRLAFNRRIAEERAVAERQVAREARFKRALEIEAQNTATKAAAGARIRSNSTGSRATVSDQQLLSPQASVQSLNRESKSQTPVVAQALPISDDELQTVYRRFTDLQNAISDRDISKVVKLTKRSGLKVQQFMQIFENSVGINVRIRNVSTSNAIGEINGTLQIHSIKRNDGTLAAPPKGLESIKIKTKREGDDWSAIRW